MSDGEYQITDEDMNAYAIGNLMSGYSGVDLIQKERIDQKVRHKRTIKYDAENNTKHQLRNMAMALLFRDEEWVPEDWDPKIVEKMMNKSYRDRLVTAGALIAAELDRLNFKG